MNTVSEFKRAVKVDLKGVATAEEALDKAGLTWEAEEHELVTVSGISCLTHKAIVRSDTKQFIGVMGNDYHPLQNSIAFSFFDSICEKRNALYEYAFIMEGGSQVVLRARVNGESEIRKNDGIIQYIDLINSFDGSRKFTCQFSIWRQICSNGLMGLKKENKTAIRHTKNAEHRINEAMRIFGKSQSFFSHFIKASQTLANKILTKKQVNAFLKQIDGEAKSTRKKNIYEKITDLYDSGKGTGKGTAWDLYNAYTEWLDHHRGTEDLRLYNSVLGATHMKEKAFDIALSI